MKVAIIHYWLLNMRGGEKVLEALLELFPEADIYTHVYEPERVSPAIRKHSVKTTFISSLPFSARLYQAYLPLMPLALEQLDLQGYDLVISSESGPAKGVLVPADAVHICYCHTPPRYLWDLYIPYLRQSSFLTRLLMRPLTHYLRIWDTQTAQRVDRFVANSDFVGKRIRRSYRRDSTTVNPPVDWPSFELVEQTEDYYLYLGHLVGYKRPDLAIRACNASGRKLRVIGDGPLLKRLRKMAGPSVEVLGGLSDAQVRHHLSRCRALLFPGVEDFGITPLEAMASGRPVVAYGRGGALETVIDGATGMFFASQTETALNDALKRFEASEAQFSPEAIRLHAEGFSRARFHRQFRAVLDDALAEQGQSS